MKNDKTKDACYEAGRTPERMNGLSAGTTKAEHAEDGQAGAATADSKRNEQLKRAIPQDAIRRREIY